MFDNRYHRLLDIIFKGKSEPEMEIPLEEICSFSGQLIEKVSLLCCQKCLQSPTSGHEENMQVFVDSFSSVLEEEYNYRVGEDEKVILNNWAQSFAPKIPL